MSYKYLILDFGKVIVAPTTGNWDITPKFLELIGKNTINEEEFKEVRKKYGDILSRKVITLEEEYNMFYEFYNLVLSNFNISKDIIKEIAYDRTYNFDKYRLYDNIHEELESLKKKYKLILLTDNWPCVIDYLKNYNLYDYFDNIYISSIYGYEKKDGILFDYPINDLNIKPKEALFIDDYEINLDVASKKGLDVLQMDREGIVKESKYRVINDLSNI